MTDKEKITIVRSDDFTSVDEELSDAISQLDESNARIIDLLENDSTEVSVEVGEESSGDAGGSAPVQDAESASEDEGAVSGEDSN
jgi:hypothetical protein